MVMSTARPRLTAEDWVEAAMTALKLGGPDAVAIEPLAASLGATKGSGYWHWGSRRALLEATLNRWRDVATNDVIDALETAGGSPQDRLRQLLAVSMSTVGEQPGILLTLVHPDPSVQAVVKGVTRDRIRFVAKLLVQSGVDRAEAKRRAVLTYGAYLGLVQLAATTPNELPRSKQARLALQQTLIDLLVLPPG